ncbi:putative mucin TcMUCII [Trypanosoma cruzi]|uniref:Mucin TcMUCII, putative n=2 Tax=Trypanosoma cruzi TaxID=5693 RepID=Q4D558_TRYCC|nr:mucin TcMUCII, putative [Trypanosoma cruzi]EAN87661.1 mucin TcMUCII, putative [Trypanosoma cruzi]PWU88919.1 putative mucin TcMUCII [Trypanosoma cruzi]|eukprot:XP_809512.1 mucin TcMUCII [Trypanosoma cruzi strain CL Brener]
MMTCRLLCALLVLALCCCPSVCVTGTGEELNKDSSSLPTPRPQEAGVSGTDGAGSQSGSSTGQKSRENSTSQASDPGTDVPETPGTEGPESIPIQEQQPSEATGTVSAQSQKENAPTTTTTTTTKAPTTTTTTTTEAPTTTTTRAPSLLRESDGSLSSSAWVCAPLLLAVSALAYTTLG